MSTIPCRHVPTQMDCSGKWQLQLRITAHVYHAQYGYNSYTSTGQINQISL